jgi:hypothetical protein
MTGGTVTLLAVLTLIGVAVAVAALTVLHLRPTGLSALRDPVSAYGISPWRNLYRTQTIATAVAAAALAAALVAAGGDAVTPAVIALVVLALARAPIGWIPMDADTAPSTPTGRRHNLLAYAAFAAASVGGFMTAIAFAATEGFESAATAATALGWVMTIASAATILSVSLRSLRPLLGLVERLIYLGMFAWLVIGAVTVLTA